MLPRVYLDTSYISLLTAWESKVPHIKAQQDATHEWWDCHREQFEPFVSDTVYAESRRGDSTAVAERLVVLDELPMVLENTDTNALAQALLSAAAIPMNAAEDAKHVAIAAFYRMAYLLTWDVRHLSNPAMLAKITAVCSNAGYLAPRIVTPLELMEGTS